MPTYLTKRQRNCHNPGLQQLRWRLCVRSPPMAYLHLYWPYRSVTWSSSLYLSVVCVSDTGGNPRRGCYVFIIFIKKICPDVLQDLCIFTTCDLFPCMFNHINATKCKISAKDICIKTSFHQHFQKQTVTLCVCTIIRNIHSFHKTSTAEFQLNLLSE